MVLYSVAGISVTDSAIVALTALTFLILYNAVSMRLRDRTDVGSQIADLSRGTADLARQIAEFGRRLAAVEGRVVSANSTGADRIQSVVGEISELGVMVKQLAVSVAGHEDQLAVARPLPAAVAEPAPQPARRPTAQRRTKLPPTGAVTRPAAAQPAEAPPRPIPPSRPARRRRSSAPSRVRSRPAASTSTCSRSSRCRSARCASTRR